MEVTMVGGPFDGHIYELPAPANALAYRYPDSETKVDVPILFQDGRYVAIWNKRVDRSIT